MTHNRTIDNQDVIFQFDYESSVSQSPSAAVSTSFQTPGSSVDLTGTVSPHDVPFPSEEHSEHESSDTLDSGRKGKGVTKPMPIPPTSIVNDLFDMSLPEDAGFPSSLRESELSSSVPSSSSSPSSPYVGVSSRYDKIMFASSQGQSLLGSLFAQNISLDMSSDNQARPNAGKGKNRETAPVLPLLNFSGLGFNEGQDPWPCTSVPLSPASGPSSYGSTLSPLPEALRVTASASAVQPAKIEVALNGAISHDVPSRPLISRCHSLSSLTHHANQSTSSLSMSRLKAKLRASQTSSNLARKLTFGKRPAAEPIVSVGGVQDGESLTQSGKARSCNSPWYATTRACDTEFASIPSSSFPVISPQPIPSHLNQRFLKAKGRSNSSPLPFSALDFVPIVTTDIFQPLPLYIRNYFDEILPTELRLDILRSIIYLHEQDYERAVDDGRWSVGRASSMKNAWVGKDKGIRELFRLSRVRTLPLIAMLNLSC